MLKRKKTYTTATNGTEIFFTLAKDNVVDYATYNETLYEILNMPCLKPFRDEGRLRFNVWRNGRNETFYFYDLAIACYKGMIQTDTFLDDLQQYYDRKSSNNLSVDHADNNVHNNTILNLSLMDRDTNTAKSSITAGFKPPYYLNTAYCGEEYRIQFMAIVPPEIIMKTLHKYSVPLQGTMSARAFMYFRCTTAEEFAKCLHFLAGSSYEWCLPEETPKTHRRKNKGMDYWASNTLESIAKQKELAAIDGNIFQYCPQNIKSA